MENGLGKELPFLRLLILIRAAWPNNHQETIVKNINAERISTRCIST